MSDIYIIEQDDDGETVVINQEGSPGLPGRNAATDLVFAFDGKPDPGHISAPCPIVQHTVFQSVCVVDCIAPPAAPAIYPIMNRAVQVGMATFNPNGVHVGVLTVTTFGDTPDLLFVVSANPADATLLGPCVRLVQAS